LKANDSKKSARNAQNARIAYDTAMNYFDDLSPDTPELADLRDQVATLKHLLGKLEEKGEPGKTVSANP
jgi:hypothetical protein